MDEAFKSHPHTCCQGGMKWQPFNIQLADLECHKTSDPFEHKKMGGTNKIHMGANVEPNFTGACGTIAFGQSGTKMLAGGPLGQRGGGQILKRSCPIPTQSNAAEGFHAVQKGTPQRRPDSPVVLSVAGHTTPPPQSQCWWKLWTQCESLLVIQWHRYSCRLRVLW